MYGSSDWKCSLLALKFVLMPGAPPENGSSYTVYTAEWKGGPWNGTEAQIMSTRTWNHPGCATHLTNTVSSRKPQKCFGESSITTLLLVVWWTSWGGPQSDVSHTFQRAVGLVSGLTWNAARLVLWLQVTPPQPVYNVCSVFMVRDGCVGLAGPS